MRLKQLLCIWEKNSLSQDQLLKTLRTLGLTIMDSQVYIFLAKKGTQKARDIAKPLKMEKQQIYRSLANLQSKGLVNSTLERPSRFTAVTFEKVLDLFVKTKLEEAQQIQQNRDELLSVWQSINIGESDITPKFMVLEGRNLIYSKILQLVQETKNQLITMSTATGLARADQKGFFDALFDHPLKSKIQIRLLTELNDQNLNIAKNILKKISATKINLKGRNPDLGLRLFPRMVIRDDEEAVFFITNKTEPNVSELDDRCLWTNCISLVQAFTGIFEDLWHNSTDMERRIVELETGQISPKTGIISDAQIAEKKFNETIRSAKKEILMTTSAEGLVGLWEDSELIKEWVDRCVVVKIMAPITGENIEAAQKLMAHIEVRHTTATYLSTTIVDKHQLFQLKDPSPAKEQTNPSSRFKNSFYSNDTEFVEKTRSMLLNIWKDAYAPSSFTIESIIGRGNLSSIISETTVPHQTNMFGVAQIENEEAINKQKEKDILDKIINAKKSQVRNPRKDKVISYGNIAYAIIHPPDYFNLPNFMIRICHFDKKSSFGAEDSLTVHLWLKTAEGYHYVPAAHVTDNQRAAAIRKEVWTSYKLEQNVQVIKKDEFQVQMYGNKLFAGWTVPIPLCPQPYTLPPSCILFEGYGEIKTVAYTTQNLGGYKHIIEANDFEAFVTYFHPASKYSGPGTDGRLTREAVFTIIPPKSQ
jgi:sugar-specific transcriptional regulator TrmB